MRGRFGVGLGMVWIDQGRFWESFGGVPGAQLKSVSTRRHNFMRKCQTMFSQKSTKVQCQNRKQSGLAEISLTKALDLASQNMIFT